MKRGRLRTHITPPIHLLLTSFRYRKPLHPYNNRWERFAEESSRSSILAQGGASPAESTFAYSKTATPQVPPPIPIQSYRLDSTYLIHRNPIQQLGRKKRTGRDVIGDRSLGVPNAQTPPFPPSTIYRTDHTTLEVTDLRHEPYDEKIGEDKT